MSITSPKSHRGRKGVKGIDEGDSEWAIGGDEDMGLGVRGLGT